MSYALGTTSLRRLEGVNDTLKLCAHVALAYSPTDMTVPWRGGLRTAEQQHQLFLDKASKCDGHIKKSFHQSGQAMDLVPWIDGKQNYKATEEFQQFAKVMLATFDFLQALGKIPYGIYLHWGGFWSAKDDNNDGYLHHLDDKFGWDCPHWELRDHPQRNKLKFF